MVDMAYLMSAPGSQIVAFLAGWLAGLFSAGVLALVMKP